MSAGPRIGTLTSDELIMALATRRSMLSPGQSAALSMLRKGAGLDRLSVDSDETVILDAIERWGTTGEVRTAVLANHELSVRRCDKAAVTAAIAMNINPWLMMIIAHAIGGVASFDEGMPPDEAITSLAPENHYDMLLLPLAAGVHWGGDRLMLAEWRLPTTLVTAGLGREAKEVVEHPLLADAGEIIAIDDTTPGWTMLRLAGQPTRWCDLKEIGRR